MNLLQIWHLIYNLFFKVYMSIHIEVWIIIDFFLQQFGSLLLGHLFLAEVKWGLNLFHLDWPVHSILFLKYTW